MKLNEPNLKLPLASSYNERFSRGLDATVTQGLDQRKINFYYEIANNASTGNKTLYLTKRPGAQLSAFQYLQIGASDIPYLVGKGLGNLPSNGFAPPELYTFDGTNTDVNATGANVNISTDGGAPAFIDSTLISGVENAVLQTTTSKVFYTTSASFSSWSQITDTDYPGTSAAGKMEHMDGYAFIAANDNYIYNSDLNSLSSWTAGNRIQKQIQLDAMVGLVKRGSMLLAFGGETVEAFVNAGNPSGSPLKRIPQFSDQRIGLEWLTFSSPGARHYYTQLGTRVYFVGRDGGARFSLGVFAFDGERFEKVSTSFIDKFLSESFYTHISTFAFYGRTAIAISLNLPNVASQRWLMFFPELNEWFEWTSTVFQPMSIGSYFVSPTTTNNANLYTFPSQGVSNSWQDGSTAYTASVQFKLPGRGPSKKFMTWAGVLADKATSTSNLSVEFSDDDYATWSTARTIDLSTDDKRITRCGSYRDRAVRLSHSANSDCRLEAFVAKVE